MKSPPPYTHAQPDQVPPIEPRDPVGDEQAADEKIAEVQAGPEA